MEANPHDLTPAEIELIRDAISAYVDAHPQAQALADEIDAKLPDHQPQHAENELNDLTQ